jgi:hypothetical protein
MRMVRLLLLLALALAPTGAAAGTRAIFVGEHGHRRTILIADNGDADVELWSGQHLVIRSGRAFLVEELLTGPHVVALDDLSAVVGEIAADAASRPDPPEVAAAMRDLEAAAADMAADAPERLAAPQPPPARPPSRDGIEVNGRSGRAYYYPGGIDGNNVALFAVISGDPALAPIGAAFRRGLDAREVLRQLSWLGTPPLEPVLDPEDLRILASGTPIQYYDLKLRDVAQVALPAIALPAEPETLAALRARLTAQAAARFSPPPPETRASRALFAGGRLYLVAGSHLLSLAEGETSLTRHDLGEPVLDACVQGGAPLALTGAPEQARAWTLRRLRGGQWQAERTIARDNDDPVALACTAEGAFLLTSGRLIDLTPAPPAALRLQGDPIRALVTAAVHVTPQAVFVGLNAGEWGGGLRRIDRRSGQVETIERNATGGLCDGPLNAGCDPVQGIAAIPWRPTCVAAAIGLIHMAAHGRLVLVCPDRIEQLYAATDGEIEDPERAREAARGGYGSIAFFGLAASGNNLLAIGHNGLHRIASDGTASHVPLPRFIRIEGLLVSFALPDVVLVVTGINGRASLSGAVPIMAVRQ